MSTLCAGSTCSFVRYLTWLVADKVHCESMVLTAHSDPIPVGQAIMRRVSVILRTTCGRTWRLHCGRSIRRVIVLGDPIDTQLGESSAESVTKGVSVKSLHRHIFQQTSSMAVRWSVHVPGRKLARVSDPFISPGVDDGGRWMQSRGSWLAKGS